MTPGRKSDNELAGLPAWLYPAGFWVAVVLLAVAVLFPALAVVGVTWVALVPVLAAVWVALSAWNRDRRLSFAALAALAGLAAVYVVKSFI
ncbi:hypothetical protein E5F05_15940 [Deinococcus metallilatus]|uniref:Uncharacterized protein n=2 Tax=Deinococcus TaxID=1298 RepID=A0AAJ5F578_9DEIO|nr:hypothetical protein [Deinococcus metallilatus]MBB5295003.1 hypothetical protein [Deinococcus metallilatus]QBY09305.1 hypothetical protein E5F05_15940 [Deinococcus metallilatus]RXJ09310.1 hypothetical protein ERJ73_14775 [Deinococcus metallilatus]TLK28832.1 hypothetical protein FCS05_06540 [Deinococcus metallilatus]GMA16936.1 hypothetical protein GCM10025871_32670 [Deinococcus metallilatus]